MPFILRTVRFGRLTGGNPALALAKTVLGELRRRFARDKGPATRRRRRVFRLAVLPFEEQHSVDAARMENCKAVFAYEDADDGRVKTIPACLWYPYRNPILEKLSRKYGVVSGAGPARAAPAGATRPA